MDRVSRTKREMQRAALANLTTYGLRVATIQVWRSSLPSVGHVLFATAAGGVLPSNLAAPIAIPSDDLGGGRYPYVGYIGGTISIENGDELRITDSGGTVVYPVHGAWNWSVIQVVDLERREDA